MIKKIIVNKNRGWRGLAEVFCLNETGEKVLTMMFSFSQDVWNDMQKGRIVVQDDESYHVLYFTNTYDLPKGQRSVLIKSFNAVITEVKTYAKKSWDKDSWSVESTEDRVAIRNFLENRNNHTTSEWNFIGVRVTPYI